MKKQAVRVLSAVLAAVLISTEAFALPNMLIPGGNTVGVKLFTDGLVVSGFTGGSAAKAAGLRKGDVIIEVDGEPVHTVSQLQQQTDRDRLVLTVQRDGKEAEFCVSPKSTRDGQRLGLYLRDSMAGIGTVTYYNPVTGEFGALGHGVNEAETGNLLPMEAGVVVGSEVAEVTKGKRGEPGELKGKFHVEEILGELSANSSFGLFGVLNRPVLGRPMPVATAREIRTGDAVILANVSGEEVKEYKIKIRELYPGNRENGRNMLLEVTDRELLDTTGGIVQGMSGSPIIQDGKLVGAVTHVLVNDPTKGYGIFIENMLSAEK